MAHAKTTHLTLTRIHTIMKSCSDVDTVGREATTLMCKAAEHFIRTLSEEAYKHADGKKLDYKHLTQVVHNSDKYEFLAEILPKKITVLEYKKILARKQREANSEDEEEEAPSSSEDEEEDSSSDGEEST